MVLIDWTLSADTIPWSQLPVLDAAIKYSGSSSLKCYANSASTRYSRAQHTTFSESQLQLIAWTYSESISKVVPRVSLASYGALVLTNSANNTWERFKVSFWYDSNSNTKWGRVERWNGAAWVQIGSDTNFGVESPAAGSMYIEGRGISDGAASYSVWFDEVEVYS